MSSFRAAQQTRSTDVFLSRQCHCSLKLSCCSGCEMGRDWKPLMAEHEQKWSMPWTADCQQERGIKFPEADVQALKRFQASWFIGLSWWIRGGTWWTGTLSGAMACETRPFRIIQIWFQFLGVCSERSLEILTVGIKQAIKMGQYN